MCSHGILEMKKGLCSDNFLHEMLVGDMVQDDILGMDFMRRHDCDLIISENRLKVNGGNVTCFTKPGDRPNCCRVVLMESIQIPANSELS